MDLPATYFNSFAYVPAGRTLTLLPVAGRIYSSLGSSVRLKNSFVCQTPSEDILRIMMAAADKGLKVNPETWPGTCSEGG